MLASALKPHGDRSFCWSIWPLRMALCVGADELQKREGVRAPRYAMGARPTGNCGGVGKQWASTDAAKSFQGGTAGKGRPPGPPQ